MTDPGSARLALTVLVLAALAAPTAAAQYAFPATGREREVAARIEQALDARDARGVQALVDLLWLETGRARAAIMLGLMRLAEHPVDGRPAVDPLRRVLSTAKEPYTEAAAEAALIVLDRTTPRHKRRADLVAATAKDGPRRRMAAEALRTMGGRVSLRVLEALANDAFGAGDDRFDAQPVGAAAFEAWWHIQIPLLSEPDRASLLVQALGHAEPFSSPWGHAACARLQDVPRRAVPLLTDHLRRGPRRAKLWAIRALEAIGGHDNIQRLLDVAAEDLDSKDRLVRHTAVGVLARHATPHHLPLLARALRDHADPHVRQHAAAALARLGTAAVPRLRLALRDPRELVRAEAAAQLAEATGAGGELVLFDALNSSDMQARGIALRGVRHLRSQQQVRARLWQTIRPATAVMDAEQRALFEAKRRQVLAELAHWEPLKLRPLAPAFEALLRDGPVAAHAANLLRKLGYQVRWVFSRTAGAGEFVVTRRPK